MIMQSEAYLYHRVLFSNKKDQLLIQAKIQISLKVIMLNEKANNPPKVFYIYISYIYDDFFTIFQKRERFRDGKHTGDYQILQKVNDMKQQFNCKGRQ